MVSGWMVGQLGSRTPIVAGALIGALAAAVLARVDASFTGTASGVLNSGRQTGGAVGVALFGALAGGGAGQIVFGLHAAAVIAALALFTAAALARAGITPGRHAA
jgi:DHA2 family methylenomycin A resistance protein-like MFS transporter